MSEDSKQKAWLEHYQRLLNVEFDWDPDHLSYQPPVEGPPIPITIDMVKKAISQMAGKAPGPSGIVVEMIRASSDMGASMNPDLKAAIIHEGKVPSDWEQSFIVCLYKGMGDALERSNFRGLKLTEQVMKILEKSSALGVPWEDLYADDLVIIAESLEECVRKLLTWKEAMEKKGLRVNAGKTKIMICGTGLDLLQSSGEFPCAVSLWSGQQQHLLQWLQALGAQEMQWAQALDKRPRLQMYTVPGNCTPLGWQTTEGSPGQT